VSVHEPASMKPTGPQRRGGGFSQAALEEISALRPRYPTTESLLLPVLHIAQREWGGWLPDEAIAAVAGGLRLPPPPG
jgi:NADH:ubiquinone oxidoreductase subunit E